MNEAGQKPKKKKGSWIDNNKSLMVFSLAAAAVIWIIVAMTAGRGGYRQTFNAVPVDVSLMDKEFAALGVYAVEVNATQATAKVVGDRVAITASNPEDFLATVEIPEDLDLDNLGNFSLPLVPANQDYDKSLINEITYEPRTVLVRFDRPVTKTFPVEKEIRGISMLPDAVRDEETVTPGEVTIRGPQAEVNKIGRCVIVAELTDPLGGDFVEDYPIQVLDTKGQEMDLEASHLSIDYTEARLIIKVLRRTGLTLRLDFQNVPTGFPLDELSYSMTTEYLEVAVPEADLDRVSEMTLGHIDLRTVNKDSTVYTFPIVMDEEYRNMDDLSEITVRFHSTGWEETFFNASGIQLLNVPRGYDVKVLGGDTIYNIKFVGLPAILEEMTADDIVVEVDLSERELTLGQMTVPVRISVPTRGLVWATGTSYSVVLQVTETEGQ